MTSFSPSRPFPITFISVLHMIFAIGLILSLIVLLPVLGMDTGGGQSLFLILLSFFILFITGIDLWKMNKLALKLVVFECLYFSYFMTTNFYEVYIHPLSYSTDIRRLLMMDSGMVLLMGILIGYAFSIRRQFH